MNNNMTSSSETGFRFPGWLRPILAVLFLAAGIFCFLPRDIRGVGEVILASAENYIPPKRPDGDHEIRQTFVAEKDNLSGAVLFAATFMQRRANLPGNGVAMLLDSDGNICDSVTFPLRKLKDNKRFKIPFAVRKDSAKKKWTIVLKLRKCSFYQADRKGYSELYLDGNKQSTMLKLWLEYMDSDAVANAGPHAYDFRFCAGVLLLLAAIPLLWRRAEERIPERVRFAVLFPFYAVLAAFCLLYREYIFGAGVYIFYDIGCDTIDQYIPVLKNFLDHPFGSGISVAQALGIDYSTSNSTRFDLFNYLLFLLPSSALSSGLLYVLFLKYETIALVSFQYFHLVFRDRKLALTGCVFWTFTQFNILWGQHYHFLTTVVCFTILLLFMEQFLRGRKIAAILFVVSAAWLLCRSPYFFYMFCIFTVFYILIRDLLRGESVRQLFLHGCEVGGCLIFGILLGCFQFGLWTQAFLHSDRVNHTTALRNLLMVKLPYAATLAGRSLSPRFFKDSNIFLDYYSAPNIFLSLLCIFMAAGLLFVRPKVRSWCVAAIAGISVLLPAFNFLMGMSTIQTRWIFMFHFVCVLGIILFLRDVRTYSKSEKEKLLLYGTVVFLMLLLVGAFELIRGFHAPLENIPPRDILPPMIFAVSYLVLYGCLLAFPVPEKFFYPMLVIVFISELVFGYDKVITRRPTVKKYDRTYSIIAGKRYRDFQKLTSKNDEFARTELSVKFSCPVMASNLPTLFSVPGATAYNSIRPAMLRTLAPEQIMEINPNVFEIRESSLANRLFGIKRKIVNHGGIPVLASLRGQSGEWKLFEMPKNRFGYVLPADAECPAPTYYMPCQDRFFLMYSHWWKTSDKVRPTSRRDQYAPGGGFYRFLHRSDDPIEIYRPLTIDRCLCPALTGGSQRPCTVSVDHPFRINLPKVAGETGIYVLLIDAESFAFSNIGISNRFASSTFPLFVGRHKYVFFIPYRNIPYFEIRSMNLQIYDMELIYDPTFSCRLDKLAAKIDASPVLDARFDCDVWSADVENRSGSDAMLCVPFSYHPGWIAVVNGKAAPVLNINNGLLGVRLPRSGRNRVVLRWEPPGRFAFRCVSLVSFALLLCCAMSIVRRDFCAKAGKMNSRGDRVRT